jgi:iron complex outermembrane receptor protein
MHRVPDPAPWRCIALVTPRLVFAMAALVTLAAPAPRAAAAAEPDAARPAPPDTLPRVVPIPGVEVSTSRAAERAPVTRSLLTREALRDLNIGQDTPMALAMLPGAYAYSDAGNGIGYSYLSLRGFPQRRISVLVNGVPLNDPQSHEVYWIDHPDLLSSASEVQVQRGVGSALYGAASLGGAVNIETSPFSAAPQLSALAGAGSWDTQRWMLEGNSGDLAGDWNLYGRYSRIETGGYRDGAFSKLWSYALAARRRAGAHGLRVNLYGGPEETRLSYLGVPAAYLNGEISGDAERDRRFNPILYENERDHFFEPHYELIHTWTPASRLALTQTLFYFDGRGYYDEQRFGRDLAEFRFSPWQTTDSTLFPREYYMQDENGNLVVDGQGRVTVESFDLVRRRTVENRHYGWVPRARLARPWGAITVGGELRFADGRHYGEVLSGNGLPPGTTGEQRYYDYHPRTFSGAAFARAEWDAAPRWQVTADAAWRHQAYRMRGDRFDGIRFDQTYDFFNPRLGVSWAPREGLTAYASFARSSREPAFRDLYDAEGVGSVPLYETSDVVSNIYRDPLVRPEKVNDWEIGGAWSRPTFRVRGALFRMDLEDELVFAGQFNTDLGYAVVGNAASSVHQGVEIEGALQRPFARDWRLAVQGNATLGDNHFDEYREVYGTAPGDTLRYDGNALGFFPQIMAHAAAQIGWRGASAGLMLDHTGRNYVDNNEDILASIGPSTILHAVAAVNVPVGGSTAQLSLRVSNLLDTRYATSGYMDYDAAGSLVPHFIPAATRGVFGQVRVEF